VVDHEVIAKSNRPNPTRYGYGGAQRAAVALAASALPKEVVEAHAGLPAVDVLAAGEAKKKEAEAAQADAIVDEAEAAEVAAAAEGEG
jgi:hypothetical protein